MIRGPQHNPVVSWSVIFLAMLAMLITQTFRFTSHWSGWVVFGESTITLAVIFALSKIYRRRQVDLNSSLRPHLINLLWMLFLPMVVQLITRSLGIGDPNELVLLNMVQNVSLVLAVMPFSRKAVQISSLLTGFLVLFVTAMTDNTLIWVASVLFAGFGLWWLMCSYWERLETKFAASSNRSIPVRPVLIALTLLIGLGAVTVATVGVPRTTVVLSGFMPTSGGNKYQDRNARSGVGEGDMLVAAEDSAFSFGPVDSEILLESKMPSLYDVASDQYGEARVKKQINKELNQAISLTSDRLRHNHQKTSSTEQAARQFDTVRRLANQRNVTPTDRQSTALFQLAGNTPLHLVTRRFDTFDGVEWSHSGQDAAPLSTSLTSIHGKPWFVINRVGGNILRGKQSHTLRIINLRSQQIPSPSHLNAIHIADVDREGFYGRATDGVFELAAQEYIPRLSVIHLISQTHSNVELIKLGDFRKRRPSKDPEETLADSTKTSPARVAVSWTQDISPGWKQIMAVTQNLRSQFRHDRMATAPADCQDIVEHFIKQRRGPDYMFASTATQLLRSLGYESQVVMGFYADPQDYDSQTMQTNIDSTNLHFWSEVHVGQNIWIPIEPTPGYQPPRTWLSWQERLSIAYQACLDWLAVHWEIIAIGLMSLVIGFRLRHFLGDLASLLLWRVGWFGATQRRIIWTVRVLEFRARLAGRARPPSITLSKWYYALAGGDQTLQQSRNSLKQVLTLADKALYSPEGVTEHHHPQTKSGIYIACSRLLGTWTSQRMKRVSIESHLKQINRS